MATTYLTRTSGSPTNAKKFTMSCWIKISWSDTNDHQLFQTYTDAGNREHMYFSANDFRFYCLAGGSQTAYLRTNRKFRDTNGWYHIVISADSTQGTASNRIKMYINGVQETSFETASYPAQDLNFRLNTNSLPLAIGRYMGSNNYYFDGLVSHFNFVDGTAYDASAFGTTDATTGEWKINTNPNVTYGNNGFFILKDGNSVTDSSPNSNAFTVSGGTLTKTEDNPSNLFCTFNPLTNVPSASYSNGNTKAVDGAGAHKAFYGTIGFTTGKYYWEAKAVGGSKYTIGISNVENFANYKQVTNTNVIIGESSNSYGSGDAIGWYYDAINKNGSTIANGVHTIATNNIMMVACDADAGKIYYGVNGTWRVANSTTFNASSNDTTFTTGKTYVPAFSAESCGWEANFGNAFFGTTAVSSAGTNASNLGIFEYDVPAGFTALSTKGLNE